MTTVVHDTASADNAFQLLTTIWLKEYLWQSGHASSKEKKFNKDSSIQANDKCRRKPTVYRVSTLYSTMINCLYIISINNRLERINIYNSHNQSLFNDHPKVIFYTNYMLICCCTSAGDSSYFM